MLRKSRLVWLVPVIIVLIAPLIGCDEEDGWDPVSPHHGTHVEYEEFTPPAGGLVAVDVETVNGNVEIDNDAGDEPWIRARKEVRAWSVSAARRIAGRIQVHAVRRGDVLRVYSELPPVDRDVEIRVSYEIECPAGLELGLSTLNGEIHITGAPTGVRADVGNGRIDAALDELRGEGAFTLVNGDLRTRIADGNPTLAVVMVNGFAELGIPTDYAGRVDLQTVNGAVGCDLPLSQVSQRRRGRLVGVLGDGGSSRIDARTVNGNIRIVR